MEEKWTYALGRWWTRLGDPSERVSDEASTRKWKEVTRGGNIKHVCVWQRMNKLIERVGRVWDETEKEQFFSYIKTDLERQCCLLILGESYVKKDLERQFRLMLEEFFLRKNKHKLFLNLYFKKYRNE